MTTETRGSEGEWYAVPVDVFLGLSTVLVVDVLVLVAPLAPGAVRLLVAAPLLLVLPGYALTTVLFPGFRDGERPALDRVRRPVDARSPRRDTGIDGVERAALSFGASVAVLPLLGLALSLTPWGITVATTVASLTVFTAGLLLWGMARRWQLPPTERFALPVERWERAVRRGTVDAETTLDAVLNVGLAVAVVLAASGVTYALVSPPAGEHYSQFALLTEDASGELVASGYPTEIRRGEGASVVFSVANHEGEPVTYTVVAELQRVRTTPDGRVVVLEESVLDRFDRRLAAGETWRRRHTVDPSMLGTDLRLSYYLYKGEVPDDPSPATADHHLFIYVNVTAGGQSALRTPDTAGVGDV